MIDFSIMEPVVADICKSLEEGIDEWEFETCTMRKKGTNTRYWIGTGGAVRETFNNGCSVTVFSKEQGERIRDSMHKRKEIISSKRQRELLQEFNVEPEKAENTSLKKRKWYEDFI